MRDEIIWVVDDDPIFRLIFSMTLKKCYPDFTVIEHENGKKACDEFSDCANSGQNIPHSIFMDINMPVMNGWECIEQIQSIVSKLGTKGPSLYIVSSSINPEDEKKAVSYPATSAYLVKPITIEVFKEIFG